MITRFKKGNYRIDTKFGTLYIQVGVGLGYQLLDSNGIVIWDYDHDMPIRHAKDLSNAKTEQEFFNTLNFLCNDEGVYFGTNKKKLAGELYQEIKDYEELNERNIKERTTKKLVYETITDCANKIGKYYALCGYWNYF